MTTKDNSGTLPINLYAADSPTVHPLDITVLSEAAITTVKPDILELKEGNLIFLLDVLHTNEVITVAEAAETVEMTETAADEVQHERIPRRRKRRFESDLFY